MSKVYYFKGTAMWAKLHRPDDFRGDKRWSIGLIPDKESQQLLDDSGLTIKGRKTDNGTLYTFRRPVIKEIKGEEVEFEAPEVVDNKGKPFDGTIGNGSTVTLKVTVYDTRNGPGHRLEAVRVDELVEFGDGQEEVTPDNVMPF